MTTRDDVRILRTTLFVEHFVGQDERSPYTVEAVKSGNYGARLRRNRGLRIDVPN